MTASIFSLFAIKRIVYMQAPPHHYSCSGVAPRQIFLLKLFCSARLQLWFSCTLLVSCMLCYLDSESHLAELKKYLVQRGLTGTVHRSYTTSPLIGKGVRHIISGKLTN